MSTASEILGHALSLPPAERASIAQSLIQSLPRAPRVFSNEQELAAELEQRIQATLSGAEPMCDADEAIRRAREAVRRVRS